MRAHWQVKEEDSEGPNHHPTLIDLWVFSLFVWNQNSANYIKFVLIFFYLEAIKRITVGRGLSLFSDCCSSILSNIIKVLVLFMLVMLL